MRELGIGFGLWVELEDMDNMISQIPPLIRDLESPN